MPQVLLNRAVLPAVASPADPRVLAFHQRLPGYLPTPLREAASLAAACGVARVLVKDESERLGLPAFKVLGASWATYRLAEKLLGTSLEPWTNLEDLKAKLSPLRPLTLVTATDGNHGRAVARVARWFGFESRIFVPAGTVTARIVGIESEGARVTVIDGSYDDAVAAAAGEAGPTTYVVSDTSWPGYEEIPAWIAEGYSTIFHEIEAVLAAEQMKPPQVALIQVGVGALAVAAIRHFAGRETVVVSVEPDDAACVLESAEAGRIVTVPGPHRFIMAGLNCGTPSLIAWPVMRDGFTAFVSVDDARAVQAMRLLANDGLVSGETGASGAAGLLELCAGDPATRRALGITSSAFVLLISTESATDPGNWERLTGRHLTRPGL